MLGPVWQLTGAESGLLMTALGVFGGASLAGLRVVRGTGKGRGVRTMFLVGALALSALLLVLLVRDGQLPLLRRSGILMLSAWVLALTGWLAARHLHAPVVLAVAAPTVTLLLFFSLLLTRGPAGGAAPVLRLGQLAHIVLALFGFAALTFGAGVAAYYLWQIRMVKRDPRAAVARALPPLEMLDRAHLLTVAFGISFFGLSVLSGWLFVAARGDPGRWWLDPTVLATTCGLAVYLLLFLARAFLGWHGRRLAWLTLTGFLVLVVGFVVAAFCTSAAVMHGS